MFKFKKLSPKIVCPDGFTVSIQASANHYCTPRNDKGPYTHFEVGYPSQVVEYLLPYAEDASKPTQTVYGWVPIELIERMIVEHGGGN